MKNIALLFLFLVLATSAAHAEGEPWQALSGIRFSGSEVGVVIDAGDAATEPSQGPFFYGFDPRTLKTKRIKEEDYKKKFGEYSPEKSTHRYGENITDLPMSNHEDLSADYLECEQGEEGGPVCKKQFVTSGTVRILVDSSRLCEIGCTVSKAEKYGDLLVIGLAQEGEYG